MRRTPPLFVSLAVVSLARVALAQPPGPRPGEPPAAPKPIEVNDPLLAQIPPAKYTLANFREVLAIVSSRNVDVIIAKQEVEKAEGMWRQALAGALPSLTAQGSLTFNLVRTEVPASPISPATTIPASPLAVGSLTLAQPLLAPRAWYGIGTANRNIRAAKAIVSDRERTVLLGVADAIVSVVTAERVSEINRVGLRSSLQLLELTQRKLRLGSGTKLDVVRAQQDAGIARGALINGDEALRKAREALGLALGSADGHGVTSTISLNEIQQSLKSICSPATPDQRADVLAAKTTLEVTERNVTDTKLAYLPTAVVSSTASVSNEQLGSGQDYAWSIQGILTIPIWEGGARYGATRIAKAAVVEQKAQVDITLRLSNLQTTQSLRAVEVATQARKVSEETRDLAKETARLAQVAFEAGSASSFDLVESARKEREAELDLAVKEFEVTRAKLAALLATANCNY